MDIFKYIGIKIVTIPLIIEMVDNLLEMTIMAFKLTKIDKKTKRSFVLEAHIDSNDFDSNDFDSNNFITLTEDVFVSDRYQNDRSQSFYIETSGFEKIITWYDKQTGGRIKELLQVSINDNKVSKLLADLQSDDLYDRYWGAIALSWVNNGRAVEPLIKLLLEDGEWPVRLRAAQALGKIGDSRAVEPLIKALDDEDWGTRERAAVALGKLKDKRAVEPLIAIMNSKKLEDDLRRHATLSLGKIGDKRANAPLLNIIQSEEKKTLIEAAADSLNEIAHVRIVDLVKPESPIK